MATPSLTWLRQYVNGAAITGLYEAPITPVNTTIKTTIAGTYGTSSQGSTLQIAPTSTGDYGGKVAFTATRDLSTRKFLGFQLVHYNFPFPGPSAVIDTLANGGISIVFYDSSANWSEFYIEGSDYDEYDLEDGGWNQFRGAGISGTVQVCLERTRTPDASSGTLSWAAIDGYELIIRAVATSGNTPTVECDSMLTYDVPELVAGDSGDPAGFDSLSTFIRASNSSYQQADIFKNSAGNFNGGIGELFEPLFTYQIGDGSTVTYFRDSGGTIAEFPTVESGIAVKPQLYLAGIDRGLEINTSATCDIELDGTILAAADVAGGESFVNVAGNTGATVLFNNCQFFRKTYVNFRHASVTSCLFDDCEQIEIDTTTVLTSATIRNTASTSNGLYTQAAAGDYTAITADFRASNAGQDITIDPPGTGTWDFAGVTVESGHTLAIHNDHVSTAITVNISAGITYSTTTAGGTVTVTQPAVSFTINSSESGSLIQMCTTTTQTVLSSATSNTLEYTHSSETIDYTIRKAGFIDQRVTGLALSGTSVATINLVPDPIYNASHGLTTVTDYNYNASTRVMTIVANQEGRDLYSALVDDFISESAYINCPFPITAIGPDRFDFDAIGYYNTATTVGATIDSGDITFWKGAGMQWEHDTTGNPTKKFYSIKSSNTLQSGSVVGYTQVVTGTPVEVTLVSDQVNQVIQFFEDTNGDASADYAYTGHLLFKGFQTGYYQARWDVVNDGGVTTLEPYEYNISLSQEAIAGTTGDQAITITTLTDHTGAPISAGGKSFDYELVDPGTNDADDLLSQTNYDIFTAVNASISGTVYTSYQAFDLPDLLVEAGANTETEYGNFEGDGAVADLSGVYMSRSSVDHPGVTRFQSNDGTYYTPAVTSNITFTGLSNDGADINLQIANETAESASAWASLTVYAQKAKALRSTGLGTENTAGLYYVATTAGTSGASEPTFPVIVGNTVVDGTVTWTCYAILFYDADPSGTGYSDTYIDGEEFDTGDTYRYRYADMNAGTTFKVDSGTGIVSSTGFTVAASPTANAVYATNGHDGRSTAITDIYTADYTTDYFVLDTNMDFTNPKSFAFYCGELTTSDGMYSLWGAVTAIDTANYVNDVSIAAITFDETGGYVKQEDADTSRWYRSDGSRPYLDPSTGLSGVAMTWKNPVYTANASDAIYTEASPEPTAVPASNAPLSDKIDFMFASMVNRGTQTDTTKTIRNTSDTADIASAAVSNDGTTFIREKYL